MHEPSARAPEGRWPVKVRAWLQAADECRTPLKVDINVSLAFNAAFGHRCFNKAAELAPRAHAASHRDHDEDDDGDGPCRDFVACLASTADGRRGVPAASKTSSVTEREARLQCGCERCRSCACRGKLWWLQRKRARNCGGSAAMSRLAPARPVPLAAVQSHRVQLRHELERRHEG